MKLSSYALAAACIALLSVPPDNAMAQKQPAPPANANSVMDGCRAINSRNNFHDLFLQGWCAGVVSALTDYSGGVCAPEYSTVQQGVRVVVAYIDARPARQNETFNKLALEALKEAWPCDSAFGGTRK